MKFTGRAPAGPEVVQYGKACAWVVVANGEYDAHSITPMKDALMKAAGKHPRVVIDTAGITFSDSNFLNLLLRVHRATSLRVVSPPPRLRRILEVTGAETVLDIRASVADAVS